MQILSQEGEKKMFLMLLAVLPGIVLLGYGLATALFIIVVYVRAFKNLKRYAEQDMALDA